MARREPAGAVYYYFSDHLGSASVVTDPAGVIKEESDYYPYGGERVVTDTLPKQNYKFTGKERDTESGLDYFGARYYSSRMGRWLTPDWANGADAVPYADFGDPQSLNLYGYVGNQPVTRFDADGHCCQAEWGFFKSELRGVWKATGGAIVHATRELASGRAATNVRETYFQGNVGTKLIEAGKEFGKQAKATAVAAAKGDPEAIGVAVGTVAGIVAPGAKGLLPGRAASTAETAISGAAQGSKVDSIVQAIDDGGFQVKMNPKSGTQEGNVTITHPNEPGVNLNLRVETHPLEPGGAPIRHANVQRVEPGPKNKSVVKSNEHITN